MRRVDALRLGPRLGTGGEAEVYELGGEPHLAVKLYRGDRPGRAAKLAAMVATPPPEKGDAGRVAWPRELVVAADGSVRGFVMPRFDPRRYRPLHQVYNPLTRRAVAPAFNTRYLLRTARNLAAAVAAVHATGAVVGDLNESNVLVDARGNVALVDCDSFQVIDDDGVLHACPVGKPEFTPPELHGVELAEQPRHPATDVFALAVLVSLLLREGRHPYAGVWTGRGDPPDLAACARRRRLPHRRGALRTSPLAVPLAALPPRVRALTRRALTTPRWRATMRPNAAEFEAALAAAEHRLRRCRRSEHHLAASRRWRACPWCALVDAGVPDPFPGPDGAGVARRQQRADTLRRRGAAVARVGRRIGAPVVAWVEPLVRRVQPHVLRALRREVPVAIALGAAALVAPFATVAAVALVVVPAAAFDGAGGPLRAARRLPRRVTGAWRASATVAGIAAAAAIAVVVAVWWSPLADRPFSRWSPGEAAEHATRTAVVAAAPAVAVATLRRLPRHD